VRRMTQRKNQYSEESVSMSDDDDFIAQLVQTNLLQSQATSSALLDSLTERAEIAEVSLSAIRDRVISLFNQEYLPNPKIVMEGLFPPQEVINSYRSREEKDK
jgi:hypothetical protein